jgi:hypothetical protein
LNKDNTSGSNRFASYFNDPNYHNHPSNIIKQATNNQPRRGNILEEVCEECCNILDYTGLQEEMH